MFKNSPEFDISNKRADLRKQVNLGYLRTLWQTIKEDRKKHILFLILFFTLIFSPMLILSIIAFPDPDIALMNISTLIFIFILPLTILFIIPLKRLHTLFKLPKFNKLLHIVQFVSIFIAVSFDVLFLVFIDYIFLITNYWIFLASFFSKLSFLFIFFVSTALSVSVKESDEVFWHLLFIHYPYLDKENDNELFSVLQQKCETNSKIIYELQDILERLSKILESFIFQKLEVKLHTSDSYNLHLSFLNNQENHKIRDAFISTILELNKGNFKNFYVQFHELIQFFRSENLSIPIDLFVFHPKANLNKFISKTINNPYFSGIVIVLVSILFTLIINLFKS